MNETYSNPFDFFHLNVMLCLEQDFLKKNTPIPVEHLLELERMKIHQSQCHWLSWLLEVFKANCPLLGPGPIGGVPSMGVVLKDPSPCLREFRRKPRKTPNG